MKVWTASARYTHTALYEEYRKIKGDKEMTEMWGPQIHLDADGTEIDRSEAELSLAYDEVRTILWLLENQVQEGGTVNDVRILIGMYDGFKQIESNIRKHFDEDRLLLEGNLRLRYEEEHKEDKK